ncbi:MAG: hypothetical protein AB8H79_09575 [Myxococcota bacterium]
MPSLSETLVKTALAGLIAGTVAACDTAPPAPGASSETTPAEATTTATEGTQGAKTEGNGCGGPNGCGGANGCPGMKDEAHAKTDEAAATPEGEATETKPVKKDETTH